MKNQRDFDKQMVAMKSLIGERAFVATEAPPVKVIPTGIMSLDIATGVGGWPRGTVIEVFGRESAGKTALALYSMTEVMKQQGFCALINLESNITKEGWLDWAKEITPAEFDPSRLHIYNVRGDSMAVEAFGKAVSSNAYDFICYDSIGAMSTDKELKPGESKQAYGQSAMVTQLIKQAAEFAYVNECVPMFLNQIRDDQAGTYILEKAPGGHAKDHFATLRLHLKTRTNALGNIKVYGEDTQPGFRVNARMVKNKVGTPRRTAGWNYWNYKSPDGVVGIDVFQDAIDCALRFGAFKQAGAWFYHDDFPEGKLQGSAKVSQFLRTNPVLLSSIRSELILSAYNTHGNIMDEVPQEVLTDVRD